MAIVVLILAVAALTWWAAYARGGSLWVGCAGVVALGYALGPPLWTMRAGPIPLTVDRVLLVGLGAAWLWKWRARELRWSAMTGFDWLLVAALAYFTIRCAMTPAPPAGGSSVKPWWRLATAFWAPALLYLAARTAPSSEQSWRRMLWGLVALGAWLALTALAEVGKQWWAVFPRYIADPTLGTHFGRARGPALNSASLGVMLAICFWATWMTWLTARRWMQLALLPLLAAMAAGVFFTYTRSTWIGLAAGAAVVMLLELPRQWRGALALAGIMVAAAGIALFGDQVTNLGRKDSDASAEHSVYQRASFVYVSMRMFNDAPLFGCGFGRFYDLKMPYLADRSQQLELESLRKLDHHNTFLSILTETGLVGLTIFVALLAGWARAAWQLIRMGARGSWQRRQGLLAIAVTVTYVSSAVFHDLTLSATDQWLLFLSAGLSVNLIAERRRSAATVAARRVVRPNSIPVAAPADGVRRPHSVELKPMTERRTIRLFGASIDAVDMSEAVATVLQWCREPRGAGCRYVVTPNVDHAVMFQGNESLRQAYDGAALVLADGAPIVLASRLLGRPLPERVAGSDLAPALFKHACRDGAPLRAFLLGAAPGVAERAAARIVERWPQVEVVGTLSPPLGFEKSASQCDAILAAVAEVQPDVLLVGLGAPKQELWVHAHADRLQAKAALCIGATIDFLAGEKRRAPRWMRRVGLEWLHRLSSEPKRLVKRYARDAWVFPQLVWRDWRGC